MEQNNARRRTPDGARRRETERGAGPRRAARSDRRGPRKKRKPVRIKDRNFWKDLFIMLAITAAVILSMVIFFKVKTVEVTGMEHYTQEQIIEASGIAQGDNLLTLSKATVASRIRAELPYVSEVQVKRSLPNRVILAVKEFDVSYTVTDSAGNPWLMTAGGMLLEQVDDRTAAGHVTITGFTLENPAPGTRLTIHADEGNESAAKVQEETVCSLMTLLEASEFGNQVVSVDVPLSFDLSFWYQDQYHVLLGTAEDLEYKLQYFEEVIRQLDSYETGEIDLSFTSDRKAIFRTFE